MAMTHRKIEMLAAARLKDPSIYVRSPWNMVPILGDCSPFIWSLCNFTSGKKVQRTTGELKKLKGQKQSTDFNIPENATEWWWLCIEREGKRKNSQTPTICTKHNVRRSTEIETRTTAKTSAGLKAVHENLCRSIEREPESELSTGKMNDARVYVQKTERLYCWAAIDERKNGKCSKQKGMQRQCKKRGLQNEQSTLNLLARSTRRQQ